jgi:ribosomal protein S6E (S10)
MCDTCQDVKVVKKSWVFNNYVIYNDAHMWRRKIVRAQIITMNIVAMDLKVVKRGIYVLSHMFIF